MRTLALVSVVLACRAPAFAAERSAGDRFAIAIERASLADVKELVESGESPDTPIEYGEHKTTPLIKAADAGRRDIVKYLLTQGAKVNGRSTPEGHTALQEAARAGFDDVVEALLAEGADVNAKDKDGYTPLQAALWGAHLDIASLLITKGADPNATGLADISPLQTASSICNQEVLRFLVENGAKVNKITQLEYGGQTALMTAVSTGQLECARTLLELGADPTLKMKSGETALSAAKETSNEEMIALVQAAAARRPARAPAGPAARPKASPKPAAKP